MQRWLPVEQNDVIVNQVTLNNVTKLEVLCNLLPVPVSQVPETSPAGDTVDRINTPVTVQLVGSGRVNYIIKTLILLTR